MVKEPKNPTKRKRIDKSAPDKILITMIFMIVAFGIVMVYSASHYHGMSLTGDPFQFVKRQAQIGLVGSLALLFITYKLDYKWLNSKGAVLGLYFLGIGLTGLLFVVGHETNGATRWLKIGGVTIQPSEIVKIGVIVAVSAFIVRNRQKMHQLKTIIMALGIIVIPAGLIAIENLSSAIVVGFCGILILFVSTPKVWYYIVGAVGVGFLVVYVYLLATSTTMQDPDPNPILQQYRLERIRVWQDPFLDPTGSGYQPIQSLYAIGSGGIFGKGLAQGVQKLGFLPEPHNDIIFAVICEELGLVGAGFLLLAYSILVIRGLTVAIHADDYFGALVATGISGMIGIQVLINVAVNTNAIPTTGMQLPMVSYGGTALLILLGSLGILVNISRTSKVKKVEE